MVYCSRDAQNAADPANMSQSGENHENGTTPYTPRSFSVVTPATPQVVQDQIVLAIAEQTKAFKELTQYTKQQILLQKETRQTQQQSLTSFGENSDTLSHENGKHDVSGTAKSPNRARTCSGGSTASLEDLVQGQFVQNSRIRAETQIQGSHSCTHDD